MDIRAWGLVLCLGVGGCALLSEDFVGDRPPVAVKAPTVLYEKALDLYQHGQYAQAMDLFQQYIGEYQDTPLFKVALYYLGHCHQKTGDNKEALTLYNRVLHTWGEEDFWGEQAMKRIRQIEGTP